MNITKNRVVSIGYTLTDDRNNVIDSTSGSESFDYLHGFENIIPGLERALEGKAQGDQFSVTIPAADAYGERNKGLVADVPLDRFQGVDPVKKGMQFHAQTPEGVRMVTVTRVAGETVTIDGNHPLAGMDLTFDVTVNAIREANAEELAHGHVHSHGHEHSCGGCEPGACDAGESGSEGCGGCCGRC
ncbi:MAG: peptidylprolyl isomerase [Treponema sp.]|jgi:FKBP-type peptidyl-prolyl cis-trans isomerase SlyD|nr:peptidylprolyl isomerase [Treponema sp.]